jgi:hypothetical protein
MSNMSAIETLQAIRAGFAALQDENEELKAKLDQAVLNLITPELKAARARIAELEAARRWVPYEERAPEVNTSDVGGEYIVVMGYPYDRVAAMNYHADCGFYTGNSWSRVTGWDSVVTHWQPLPAAPEAANV